MLSFLNPVPSIPEYAGPHKVGSTEYEIPVSEITSTSTVPDTRITTIKFRLYYPTTDISSKKSLYWLPSPQKQWTEAYASFMGASERTSSIVSSLPSLLNYAKIPATPDAPPAPNDASQYPLLVFSHGLGGNCQTYSSILGSLASCGVVCVAPEHRDGSAPISIVKSAPGEVQRTIPYQKHSHAPSPEVLDARNAQLRIRLWELDLTYAALKAMNEGKTFTNYADSQMKHQSWSRMLDLQPGHVSWAGHSFGAATMTQFVKSIFYHRFLPTSVKDTPLYAAQADGDLVAQITSESPVALLDLWTMPLRGQLTEWLWDRPMPCWSRPKSSQTRPNTVAIMSAEFYKWTDLLNRTRALLSERPRQAMKVLEEKHPRVKKAPSIDELPEVSTSEPTLQISELNKRTGQEASSTSSSRSVSPTGSQSTSPSSSQTSLAQTEQENGSNAPQLYLIPQTAHLSQSDFGPLFPSLIKYFMKAIEPEETIKLNVRAILATMRGQGLPVSGLVQGDDRILDGARLAREKRWVKIPLVDV